MTVPPTGHHAMLAGDSPDDARRWRQWLAAFLLTTFVLGVLMYAGVVLMDPFSTGRFALSQSVDIASRNPRLFKRSVARDPRFDAAIFGSSTGYPLDPQKIGGVTGWQVAQLAIPASLPPSQLLVARAFQQHRRDRANLQVHVLDRLWCRPGNPAAGGWGAFPDWIYESSDGEYLSRILFPEGVTTAMRRFGIRLGLIAPLARSDGFVPSNLSPIPRSVLAGTVRPSANPDQANQFPALDLLAAHVAALPGNVQLVFVFAPPYLNTLPVAGSAAEGRLQACKARVREIAALRMNAGYLDLMVENAISRDERNYFDELHYTPAAADKVAEAIIEVLTQNGLVKH